MEERATGIILRTRPLTETSLIVTWITLECGRISTVAKGARRPKSPFVGKLDLYYEADFAFTRSRRSDLHTLREVVLRHTHHRLREDLGWLQQAAYFGVLIELATETETPIPEIHALLHSALAALPLSAPDRKTTFAFELKLLRMSGFEPGMDQARISEGTRAARRFLESADWAAIDRFRLSPGQGNELNHLLVNAIAHAWERIPAQRTPAIAISPGNRSP